MPLFFLVPAAAGALLWFLWKKLPKGRWMTWADLGICIFTWVSIVYQFVQIAHYIDDSGTNIDAVLGPWGLSLAWGSLFLFSGYVLWKLFDTFGNKSP